MPEVAIHRTATILKQIASHRIAQLPVENTMLYVNVWLTVKDQSHVASVRELLAEQQRLSRAEPGCHRFEVYQSTADETRFLLNEHWESQEAIDAHRRDVAYTQIYQPKVLPLVVRDAHPSNLL